MEGILKKHKEVWEKKKILRVIYADWYKKIISDLTLEGKSVELGSGSGNFKEFKADIISSDIDDCDWLDMCFDAHEMPFKNASISNIVMIDVLHHLSDPIRFFHECERVLKKGGRVIMLEPFPTFFSSIAYRLFHPEPFLMNVDYFQENKTVAKDPWESNQAIPFLLFFKHFKKWQKKFGKAFHVIRKEKISFILYPLSGGFENRAMIPDFVIPFFNLLEKILYPLRSLMAFRTYIVIERK